MIKLNRLLSVSMSILLSATMTFQFTASHYATAVETSSSSRRTNKDDEDEPSESEMNKFGSWVDTKDDWRHGIIRDQGSSGGNGTSYKLGQASGEYAIDLSDGSWYWYHQGSDKCVYCGDWSSARWGNGDMSNTISVDGCGVYSMSIIISNLTNQVVDPIDWLEDCGSTVTGERGSRTAVKTKGPAFAGRCMGAYNTLFDIANEKYGLEFTDNLVGLSSKDAQAKVDETLDSGGMVWFRMAGSVNTSKCWWPNFATSSHYIPIRSHDEDGYYILDECQRNFDNLNKPIPWDVLWNNKQGDCLFGVTNPNMDLISGGGSIEGLSGDWYKQGSTIGKYKNKVKIADGYYLYDGLPWDANGSTYLCDTDVMLEDLFDYVSKVSGGVEAKGSYGTLTAKKVLDTSSRMYNDTGSAQASSGNWQKDILKYDSEGGRYYEIDKINCISVCVPQAIMDPNYCNAFGGYDKAKNKNYWMIEDHAMAYNYGRAKMALAVKQKSTGKVYYLPATLADAKGHTFPGGVAQTSLALSNGYGANQNYSWEVDSKGNPTKGSLAYVSGSDFGGKWSGNLSELGNLMNQKIFGYGSKGTAWDAVWNVAECWSVNKTVAGKVLTNSDYRLIGVVMWYDTVEKK